MKATGKIIANMIILTLLVISIPANMFTPQILVSMPVPRQELKSVEKYYEAKINIIDDSIFPDDYPEYLKQGYILLRQIEQLKQLDLPDQEIFLNNLKKEDEFFYRMVLEDEEVNAKQIYRFAQSQVEPEAFDSFLKRFGININNPEDVELEILAQIERMRRREDLYYFMKSFDQTKNERLERISLVKNSMKPRELEYALGNCKAENFEVLLNIVKGKEIFGPQTTHDEKLLQYLEENWRSILNNRDTVSSRKWRSVIAQLVSQKTGQEHSRLPFNKLELFAMMRNAERTLKQRQHAFIDLTSTAELDEKSMSSTKKLIKTLGKHIEPLNQQRFIAYGFLDNKISIEVEKLIKIYENILANYCSGQSQRTKSSILNKKELLILLKKFSDRRLDVKSKIHRELIVNIIKTILESRNELYRFPFIRGIIILEGKNGHLSYRFLEEFPMIIAGATYPYQWKHDNEVNIALLLANVDPYLAAQAVRFIIYYGMWRGNEAKKLGLYGWLSQIIFGDRQTGKLPEFDNKIYYYFPDFRFRPTKKIDNENERNRTSEIMQLPFFGWTVWRVYEELSEINQSHALAFLEEVYPYVRANTEAIRTALDPFNEGILSGRDAWVNGMDNAWYHQMVMFKHLPERFMPKWAIEIVKENRVDNRVNKKPGNPVDPKLAKGRPTEYYYIFKIIFYDIMKELGLNPKLVYHASPYNSKDVAITAVMARSLESQISMAEVLNNRNIDIKKVIETPESKNEIIDSWEEELARYQAYLNRMKKAMNDYLWSEEDNIYYNCDITQIFPSVVEQQFCNITLNNLNQIIYHPREEYWSFESDGKGGGKYVLNEYAYECLNLDQQNCSISMDLKGKINYIYNYTPVYWEQLEGKESGVCLKFNVKNGDPFIVEQFCNIKKDEMGKIYYEPDPKYWITVREKGEKSYKLNDRAKLITGKGARKLVDGDLLKSPAIAGFFPLFGHIPSEDKAFNLSKQIVNPWMWWPVNGMPIPTQPMMIKDTINNYIPNIVYDPDKYWLGPSWMSSTKPVIDGFNAYGYEMLYLYIVQKTITTLQNGRAVEHWNPETGEINTTNINFPWAASCMAGSIWEELTKKEQGEYLQKLKKNKHIFR